MEGKLPVFTSRAPGSPASASRELSHHSSPKSSIIPPTISDFVGGLPAESTNVDFLASMGTAREAGARGGVEDVSNSLLGSRAIRLSKDVVSDPTDDMPLPMDMRTLAALQQQLDQQHDHERRQKKRDRGTFVPLRDPMRNQVPTPRSKDQDDAAGGGGSNSNGGSSARKTRHGSMAWMNQVRLKSTCDYTLPCILLFTLLLLVCVIGWSGSVNAY